MANREPIQYIEIDVDYCSRTYGSAPCTAALGTTGDYKCFNTYFTCQDKTHFNKTTKTLRFVNNRANLPKTLFAYPALVEGGVSATTSTVNIAGSDSTLGSFGRRATITVRLQDFVDNDINFDKYWQERISGAAQVGGVGYNPTDYGLFFTRLRSRWPYYAGRALRVIDDYVDNTAAGSLFSEDTDGITTESGLLIGIADGDVEAITRHFIITDIKADGNGNITIEGKDVLALADDSKSLCPKISRGKILEDITTTTDLQTFALTPAGIGAEYPTSGWATIGSEVVSFTRSSDTITLTGRGLEGTVASTHSVNDTFQVAYKVTEERIDGLVTDLMVNYGNIPSSYIPTATWATEIDTWCSSLKLNTIITKPTGVSQLIGELADIGISVWWDDVDQKIGLLANHPVLTSQITYVDENNNLKSISVTDNDEDRLTQVHYYVKQTDPTKDYKDKTNYDQVIAVVDTDAEATNAFGSPIVREVFCRWLNTGAENIVQVLAKRLLKRFNLAPKTYVMVLDAKDRDISLTDVLSVQSRADTDVRGFSSYNLTQVTKKTESKSGHEITVTAQAFQYDGRFGYVTANTYPEYDSATPTQIANGAFMVDEGTLLFSDGTGPYVLI